MLLFPTMPRYRSMRFIPTNRTHCSMRSEKRRPLSTRSVLALLAALALLVATADGQTTFDRIYGNEVDVSSEFSEENVAALAVEHAGDGGYFIAGVASRGGTSSADVYLLKVDRDGAREWTRRYELESAAVPRDVVRASNGDFVIVGDGQVSIAGPSIHDVPPAPHRTSNGGERGPDPVVAPRPMRRGRRRGDRRRTG